MEKALGVEESQRCDRYRGCQEMDHRRANQGCNSRSRQGCAVLSRDYGERALATAQLAAHPDRSPSTTTSDYERVASKETRSTMLRTGAR